MASSVTVELFFFSRHYPGDAVKHCHRLHSEPPIKPSILEKPRASNCRKL